jgi:hypothetical protein
MDRVHRYAKKYCDGKIVDAQTSESKYYHFNGGKFILRISNHVGRNSSGNVSIIIDKNGYMLHNHSTGAIQIITWEEIKKFIRAIATLSGINISMNITSDIERGLLKQKADGLENQLQSYKDKNANLKAQVESLKKGGTTQQHQIQEQKNRIEELKKELEETTEDLDATYKNWRELYEAALHHPIHTWLTLKSKEKEKNK